MQAFRRAGPCGPQAPGKNMPKKILVFGALLTVVAAALVITLGILDVISVSELKTTLGKTVSVIGVMTIAAVLAGTILKIGASRP